MAAANRQGKMINYIDYRMRVTLMDSRQMVGQMLAFDKHMNLILADSEEFRKIKSQQKKSAPGSDPVSGTVTEEKRSLGLVILRGANIVSVSVESPPPSDPSARLGKSESAAAATPMASGPGVTRSIGRGLPVGLQGPAAGVGGQGFGGFGGPGAAPPGFAPGRGGPPPGFPGGPPGGPPPGFQPPPNFQGGPPGFPPQGGRGFPPGAPGAPPGFPPGR